jgi:peptide/nickel transport system substrate-binding protein
MAAECNGTRVGSRTDPRGRPCLAAAAALLAAGAALFAAASVDASQRTRDRRGGTLRVDLPARFRFVDPALSFSWILLHPTNLYLLGYPDRNGPAGSRIVPEAAAFPRISRDGRTFTFTIRRGFRFSDGTPVTAAHFAHGLNRVFQPTMQSPAATYVLDIAGAEDVLAGRAQTVAGIRARGQVLTIRLTRPAPDFLARIAMPFFAAVPLNFPVDANGVSQTPLHSAGPYFLREFIPTRSAVLARNPFWRRSLLPRRPANADRVDFTFGVSAEATKRRIEGGEADLGPIGTEEAADLYRRYGLRGRFRVLPRLHVNYLFFNHRRPLFRGNVPLKRAVNLAIDRPQLARHFGYLAGRRTDQILPPFMPGFHDQRLYPLAGANVVRARQLARGHLRDGKAVMYTTATPVGTAIAGVVKFNLAQIGLDVEVRAFSPATFFDRVGRPEEPFDIIWLDWVADYGDPSNYIDQLFDGRTIRPDGRHFNFGFFDAPAVNRKIEAASRLSGARRRAAYARLDLEIMRDYAPVAPFLVLNARTLYGRDVGCWSFHPITAAPNLAALCKLR